MKKIISLLLCMALVFGLCACGGLDKLSELPPLPTFTSAPAATPQPAEASAAPVPTEEPKVETPQAGMIVEIRENEYRDYDPQNGENLILTFSYETPVVLIEDRPAVQKAINEYIAILDETYYTGEDYGEGYGTGYMNMLTEAEDNYNYVVNEGIEGANLEFSCIRTAVVMRGDNNVLSVRYTDSSYTGGAHGMYDYTGYTFDTQTGKLITLDTLTDDFASLAAFLTGYMVNLANYDEDISGRIDLVGTDLESALGALVREGSWYLADDGMHVYSSLYEISSYAAGIIDFVIPYEELSTYIKPEYMPVSVSAKGGINAVPAEEAADAGKAIVGLVKTDEVGTQLYITVDGSVQNVKVSSVIYSGVSFYETAQLWYCSLMSDCALQIQTDIPDGMPKLMISFDTLDGQSRKLLTQSGDDGHLILLDDDVMAVG